MESPIPGRDRNLGCLRLEATQSCEYRGHSMEWADPCHGETSSIQKAYCGFCGKEAQIIARRSGFAFGDVSGEATIEKCVI